MARVPSIPSVDQPGAVERFYQVLLQLDRHVNALALLDEALRLLSEITRATTAYIEVFELAARRSFSHGYDVGRSTHATIAASISRDVVAQVVAERRTLAFDSGAGDHRVATLCVPIRTDAVIGIVWLARKRRSFSNLDRERTQLLAGRLAAMRMCGPRRTLAEEREMLHDLRVRDALKRCCGNVSEAARDLDVSRAFIYSVMRRRRERT